MLLRDLVARVTFQVDSAPLRGLDSILQTVRQGVVAIAGTAFVKWGIDTAASVSLTNLALEKMAGEDFPAIVAQIKKLKDIEASGGKPLWSDKTLRETAYGLEEVAHNGKLVAGVMEVTSLMAARAKGDFEGLAKELMAGILSGNVAQVLYRYGLMTYQESQNSKMFVRQIGEATGVFQERMVRAFGEGQFEQYFDPERIKKLRAELAELQASDGGKALATGAALSSLWEHIATLILKTLTPALETLSGLMDKLTEKTEIWGKNIDKVKKDWEPLITWLQNLFKSDIMQGASLGAVLMFLLTRNPRWIVMGAAAGSFVSILSEDWSKTEAILNRKYTLGAGTIAAVLAFLATGSPSLAALAFMAGAEAGSELDKETERVQKEHAGKTPAQLEMEQREAVKRNQSTFDKSIRKWKLEQEGAASPAPSVPIIPQQKGAAPPTSSVPIIPQQKGATQFEGQREKIEYTEGWGGQPLPVVTPASPTIELHFGDITINAHSANANEVLNTFQREMRRQIQQAMFDLLPLTGTNPRVT